MNKLTIKNNIFILKLMSIKIFIIDISLKFKVLLY